MRKAKKNANVLDIILSPDYKSNKNYLQRIKAHGSISRVFQN